MKEIPPDKVQMKRPKDYCTLPETKSSPLRMMVSNRNLLLQGSIFRGRVSFREGR